MIDYWTLEFIASFLLVVGFTRTLTLKIPWSLWHLTTYTLLALIAAVSLLLVLEQNFHVEVYFAGVAVVLGLTWTGLAQDHRPLHRRGHVLSVAGALLITVILTSLALNYQWWTAPLIVLGLIGLAFVRDFIVIPTMNWARKQKGLPPIAWEFEGDVPTPSQAARRVGGLGPSSPGRDAAAAPSGPPKPSKTTLSRPLKTALPKQSPKTLPGIAPRPKPRYVQGPHNQIQVSCASCGRAFRVPVGTMAANCPACRARTNVGRSPGFQP